MQQFKTKEQALARLSLEAILRLVWVYMIRIKGEKSSDTNQRLNAIVQSIFPRGTKLVIPKEMPANLYVKIIHFIAYEKLDFAMKEIIYELLSIDVNSNINSNSIDQAESSLSNSANFVNSSNSSSNSASLIGSSAQQSGQNLLGSGNLGSNAFKNSKENLIIIPLRMEIGLKAFIQIADTLQQQKEAGLSPPTMPLTFSTPNNDQLLSNFINKSQRVTLSDLLAKEIGLGVYFDLFRRAFQDILKTLDFTIGRTFLMTRPENTVSSLSDSLDQSSQISSSTTTGLGSSNTSNLNLPAPVNSTNSSVSSSSSLLTAHTKSTTTNVSSGVETLSNTGSTQRPSLDDLSSNSISLTQLSKDLIFNADNKSRLSLFRTCVALIPRVMPLFKETELIDILTRLTIHLDDELKLIAFQTLKTLISDYPQWRKYVFTGFTNFILKEISDLYPKLIENALKMLIQLLSAWKLTITNLPLTTSLDECCQILYHLEGFSLFSLCHTHLQRRRYALLILKECKTIGELTKCFKFYPFHNYTIDVLDLASISAMKQLHLQCFNSGLIVTNIKPDLGYLIEQSASWDTSINTASYNNNDSNAPGSFSASANPSVPLASAQQHPASNSSGNSTFYNIINKSQRTSSVSSNQGQQSASGTSGSSSTLVQDSNSEITIDPSSSSANSGACNTENENQSSASNSAQTSASTSNQAQSGSSSLPHQTQAPTNTNFGTNTNIFTFDPWTECLAIFFSYEFIFTKCPQARVDAWPFIYTRLQQLLPYVDPNEQPHEMSRTSILFGVGSNSLEKIRRAATERDISLNLWKNYLIGACCLTSGSDRYMYYQEYEKALIKTDDQNENAATSSLSAPNQNSTPSAINVDFTVVESTSKFYTTFGTATSLLKMIVPFLKCECNYFREIIIRGLGRINIEAMRDLVDEILPYIKESLDKRQEKMRRMRKKDWVRLALVRVFELMAEQRTLGKRIIDTVKKSYQLKYQHQLLGQQHLSDEQQLRKTFNDYIEGMHFYLDQESEKHSDFIVSTRLHFSMFLFKLIDSVQKEKRVYLFNESVRYNLFYLCDKWSGRFSLMQHHHHLVSNQGQGVNSAPRSQSSTSNTAPSCSQTHRSNPNHLYMHQNHYHHHNCYHYYEELELGAMKACASILCCGNTFEYFTNKSSIVFTWLSQLIENANVEMKMYDFCKSTLPNEIYMISLNVCVQLLELSLYNISMNSSSTSTISLSVNSSPIFDWVIQKCYSSISQETADLCYIALAKVYLEYLGNTKQQTNKNFKSQFDSLYLGPILTLVLLNIGSSKLNIHETSIRLLRAINKCFLQDTFSFLDDDKQQQDLADLSVNVNVKSKSSTLSSPSTLDRQESAVESFLNIDFDIINSMVIYSKSQAFISEYIAKKNTEQTMFIFSEITSRFEQCASFNVRRTMLNLLVPWFYNLELIDPNVISPSTITKNTINNLVSLQSGYGSVEGTNLILNNLFYLTCKFSDQFTSEFELLWAILASTWRSNLKIICRYIFVVISLAPYEVLNNGKKVICYLSKICPERIVDELATELELMDCFSTILDKCENTMPFYKYNRPATIPPSPPPSPKQQKIDSTNQNSKKSSIYFVNQNEDDDDDVDENNFDEDDQESIEFINQSGSDNFDEQDDSDDEEDEDEDEDGDSSDQDSDSDSNSEDDIKLCEYGNKKEENLKLNVNLQQQHQQQQKDQTSFPHEQSNLKLESSQLPLPANYQSFSCPLNILLFHLGHHHNQHSHYNYHHQVPIYSYHNNYLHHNHYQHITNLTRGSISLMLLTELVCSDGADFDWTQYLPILFHFCLINFDNTKQLIGEHAKKLFLGIIYILTVQNELNYLTDYLVESTASIIDNQSIIFDRKYTTSGLVDSPSVILNNVYSTNVSKMGAANCHYNYNFNTKIFSANLKGHSNNLLANNVSLMSSPSHRNLINMHSAPSSPSQNPTNSQNSAQSNTKTDKLKSSIKKINKLQKAKEHLSVLLNILAKCKNSPVWPHELITPQNYPKQLTSVQILNDFVSNLKSFLQICFSTKQVSTISSTRSFSSPLNLTTRFNSSEKSLNQIDKKWSHYALITSLSTTNRHYAGRSLQIYRALGLRLNSFSTMINLIYRLKETVTDLNEDVQGYVTEMLLTLKMNASLYATEYVALNTQKSDEPVKAKEATNSAAKQKSKSLKPKQEKLDQKKKYSTAIGSELSSRMKHLDLIKAKTATLSRKQVNQLMCNSKTNEQRLSTKFKHQISYRKCLTLSLFNYKWQILQDRVGASNLVNKKNPKFLAHFNSNPKDSKLTNSALNTENLRLLVQIFWTSICLLESDFEHEFVLAIEIIEQILNKIDLNSGIANNAQLIVHKNEFRTNLELFAFRINWPNFPGLQNLLLKGCTSQSSQTVEATQRLLVTLIPYCSRLNFVDPCGMCYYGLWGVSMNLLALLPSMILNYDNPNDLCIKAAEQYCKILRDQCKILEDAQRPVKQELQSNDNQFIKIQKTTKIEQLKNLHHVMNLYMTKSFGKDRAQWTKCVITYLSEFFQQCQLEQNTEDQIHQTNTNKSNSTFYYNWIVFLTELLEKSSHNPQYQSCVLTCLHSLLNYINFSDQTTWAFINEELLRVVTKFLNTSLWSEALELVKLTVSKSSSLTCLDSQKTSSPRFFLNDTLANSQVPGASQVPSSTHTFFGKKELPGRTLDFEFDFSLFVPSKQDKLVPPLNLINLHSNKQFGFLSQYLGSSLSGSNLSSGWKRPHASQVRTREKLFLLLNTLTKHQSNNSLVQTNENSSSDSTRTSLQKSPSVIFENSLNNSGKHKLKENLEEQDEQEENLNLITNISNTALSSNNLSPLASIGKSTATKMNSSNSSTASSSNSSTTASSNTNRNSSTNSSFNQTSFIFSPEKEKDSKRPSIPSKPIAPVVTDQTHRISHSRANSMSFPKPGPVVSVIGSGMNTYSGQQRSTRSSTISVTPGVSQHVVNHIDDNNFINNTFSFLDDLDSNAGDFVTDFKEMNKNRDEKLSNPTDYENFAWHAIYPASDGQQAEQNKSKTLPHENSSSSDVFNISSKSKPIAPKIKGSVTIGVSSGISAIKSINNFAKSIRAHGEFRSESTDGSKQEFQSSQSIDKAAVNIERRRSVTRIVCSDSLNNLSSVNANTKNAAPGPPVSSQQNQSNRFVFY